MKRRIITLITIIAIMITLAPIPAMAAGAVKLNPINDKKAGDEVIISGNSSLDETTIKVLRPNNTVLYLNVIKGSPFQDKFTLPEDALEGYYTVIAGQGSIIDTVTFKVTKQSEIISVSEIRLDKTSLSLEVGETYKLTATIYPENATNKNVSWSSSNDNIAVVDNTGKVIAKSAGTVTITVKTEDGGKTAKCEVTVTKRSSGGGSSKKNSSSKTTETNVEKEPISEIPKKNFNDMNNFPWAKDEIEFLASKGIIKGTSSNTFSPEKNITRADFILLLVRAMGLEAEYNDNFADIKESDYYYDAIAVAKKLGIINGMGNNRFNPQAQITRQDLMVIVYRALKAKGYINIIGTDEDIKKFIDANELSDYAMEGVAALIKNGIIKGADNNRINPRGNATRAETAVIIYRIYNLLMTK